MTKATNNKAYQTRPKKKAYRHTFPITWLTKDNTIAADGHGTAGCMAAGCQTGIFDSPRILMLCSVFL